MKLSSYCDCVMDVTEELVMFMLRMRDAAPWLMDWYSARKENAEARGAAKGWITRHRPK